ncbi:unnamed protein product [Vitrella brassicaformis CCMP3155]|uniref:Uncharacterized protein n=1 Tax=Vitrella brassicaformis (strain CCMP3155) TaxID=1169540 RepID=A0A0G4EY89_VITBC|nr:unnamed protein product [Vitrella brassicaformis CCMP3155]|eukprot:CEM03405.1 unnamed protein product [Vitrella brassicaformis CCMP3155]
MSKRPPQLSCQESANGDSSPHLVPLCGHTPATDWMDAREPTSDTVTLDVPVEEQPCRLYKDKRRPYSSRELSSHWTPPVQLQLHLLGIKHIWGSTFFASTCHVQTLRWLTWWLCLCTGVLALSAFLMHRRAQINERHSPLDFIKAHMLMPFYAMQCPASSSAMSASCAMPRVFIISARPEDDARRIRSRPSWASRFDMTIINTTAPSLEYNRRSKCRTITFGNRLFYTYQSVFRRVLANYSDPGFIFIEDDVELADAESFRKEAYQAAQDRRPFYSLWRASPVSQPTCIYAHGTCAFYVTRGMMQQLIAAPMDVQCRLPIDIYIASTGPWYSTQEQCVTHEPGGRCRRCGTGP